MRNKLPKPTLWERTLSRFAPGYAAKVYQTRAAFAQLNAYHGANRTRRALSGWTTSSGDADADLLADLPSLRESSRDLYRNNTIGGAAIDTCVVSVVGTGLSLQCTPNQAVLGLDDDIAKAWAKNVEAEFLLWGKKADIAGQLDFYGLQELAFRSCLENGDVLASMPFRNRAGTPYGLKVQLTEADRVSNPSNQQDTDTFSGGVERDSDGMVKKYHIQKTHPGNLYNREQEWLSIPAFNGSGQRISWLLYHKLRIGQNRGVPFLAPVVEEIKQLSRMTENEIMRAVVSSLFTVFIKSSDGSGLDLLDVQAETGGKSTDKDFKLGNGNVLDLADGEDVTFAEPKIPNVAFDAFHAAVCKQIGARVGIPVEILLKLFSTSYTAAQAAFLEAWRFFRVKRDWLGTNFCDPIYELFLTEAVALGRVSAPGFLTGDPLVKQAWLSCNWVGDAPGHIRESEAIEAAKARIDAGLSNEAIEITALTGLDRDQVYSQRRKEIEQRRADNMMPSDLEPKAQSNTEQQQNDGDADNGQ